MIWSSTWLPADIVTNHERIKKERKRKAQPPPPEQEPLTIEEAVTRCRDFMDGMSADDQAQVVEALRVWVEQRDVGEAA